MCPCLSVTSRCSIKRDEQINLGFGSGLLSTSPTLCFKEIQLSLSTARFRRAGQLATTADTC